LKPITSENNQTITMRMKMKIIMKILIIENMKDKRKYADCVSVSLHHRANHTS
jgi:hypothetical protein